jgi:FHS family Na+ dependent glucose MFS transporter 1
MTTSSRTASSPTGNPLIATAAYYLSFITLGLILSIQGPSLPALAQHTGSRLDQISLIFVFGSLGYMAGSYFGGRGYDRWPGHRFMSVSVLVTAAMAALIPVVPTLWLLLLVMFMLGLANGTLDVGCNTLLQWVHGDKVGPFMNGLHFFFGVGSFIAPLLLARFLSMTQQIHWAFWSISLISLPLAAWLWTLPDPHQPARMEAGSAPPIPVLPVVLIVLSFFVYVGAELGFGNWIYTYALTLGLGTTITAAYLTSAFWGFFTVGRLLGVWISTRLRSYTILLIDLAGCLASLGLIILGRESVALLWAGSIGLGLFMASIFPTMLIFAGERMHVSGKITGWCLVGSGLGGMFMPWLIGQIFVTAGPPTMMTAILGAAGVNLLLIVFFASLKRPLVPQAA